MAVVLEFRELRSVELLVLDDLEGLPDAQEATEVLFDNTFEFVELQLFNLV